MLFLPLVSLVSLVSLALLAAGVFASPDPCSDHPGVVHKSHSKAVSASKGAKKVTAKPGGIAISTVLAAAKKVKGHHHKVSTKKPKKVPKVKATTESLLNGASTAINQFESQGYLDKETKSQLEAALKKAIAAEHKKAKTVTIIETKTHTKTKTATAALATVTVVTSNSSYEAALDVKKALDAAFAAVDLSQSGLDKSTIAALEACLTTVMENGGLPSGYNCLTESGSSGAGLETTLKNILEQFVGILPNVILADAFDSISPYLTTLLPASEAALVKQIEQSIESVTASLSGNSVTAMEQIVSCYVTAIQQSGNTSALACFESSAYSTLVTATESVIEQFVGVLPASLVTTVENIITYNLGNTTDAKSATLAAQVQAQISNAINSAASTISGNTVTLMEILQSCSTELIATGNVTAAQECIASSAAPTVSTITILGIAEQFEGYIPSAFFSDLTAAAQHILAKTPSALAKNATLADVDAAFGAFFNNATGYGPAYETCIEQVEKCVVHAIEESGTIDAVCPGPVLGCLGSSSSSGPKMMLAKRADDEHVHVERTTVVENMEEIMLERREEFMKIRMAKHMHAKTRSFKRDPAFRRFVASSAPF